MELDIGKLISFGFSWMKDKTCLKYFVFLFVFYAIIGTISNYIGSAFFKLILLRSGTIAAGNIPFELISEIIYYAGFVTLMGIISGLVGLAMFYLITSKAFKLAKGSSAPLTAGRYLRLIVLMIASGLVAGLSIFKLKWLWILIAGLALVLLGAAFSIINPIITGVFFAIGAILFIIYIIVFIYNGIRITFGDIAFIEKEQPIMKALKRSWDVTAGRIWEIILAMIVLGAIIWIINFILGLPASTYISFATLATINLDTIATQETINSLMGNSTYNLLSVPIYLGSAITVLTSTFYLVGIYLSLSKGKK